MFRRLVFFCMFSCEVEFDEAHYFRQPSTADALIHRSRCCLTFEHYYFIQEIDSTVVLKDPVGASWVLREPSNDNLHMWNRSSAKLVQTLFSLPEYIFRLRRKRAWQNVNSAASPHWNNILQQRSGVAHHNFRWITGMRFQLNA